MEGQLSKFTNVVKGWQYRWFVLDSNDGTLTYFLCNEKSKKRGFLPLANAVISPCEEDTLAFTVSACGGDVYKLRAADAKERQYWVNIIRCVAEFHGKNFVKSVQRTPLQTRGNLITQLRRSATLSHGSPSHLTNNSVLRRTASVSYGSQFPRAHSKTVNPIEEELKDIKNALASAHEFQTLTVKALEYGDPENYNMPSALDEQVLLLKATSQATVNILQQCYDILQKQSMSIPSGLPQGATVRWVEAMKDVKVKGNPMTKSVECTECAVGEILHVHADFDHINQYAESEVEDEQTFTDSELEDMESHKSVVLHILSQLKLGMDLTRVLLPTFVLEKRSLLEMYADFLGHTELFLRICDYKTPDERMLAVLIFYLTSFHIGRKSGVAKKPYNPILGERFHCSMIPVPDSPTTSRSTDYKDEKDNMESNSPLESANSLHADNKPDRVYFVAEQVSHHPPISAFYAECPSKQISMSSHIWTKSKFYGMSIGVINVGEGVISLPTYNEDYRFSFPNAYCRSILSAPWIELGGKTYIHCHQTGYSAGITFHTKPFYGGKPNHITFDVKRPSGEGHNDIICQGDGAWDGVIEINLTNSAVEKKIIDVSSLEVTPKHVRPHDMQAENESRKVWSKVTDALLSSDLERASAEKHIVEQKQRLEAKERLAAGVEWKPMLFQKKIDEWIFNPLISDISKPDETESVPLQPKVMI